MTERKTRHEAATPRLPRASLHPAKGLRSIQRRAADHDGRIVPIGALVFFSTDTGDAWMLEPADQLAARLATDGDPLPVHIGETETRYAIGWQGRYRIEAQVFIYEGTGSHRMAAIQGYPVQQPLRAIDEAKRP